MGAAIASAFLAIVMLVSRCLYESSVEARHLAAHHASNGLTKVSKKIASSVVAMKATAAFRPSSASCSERENEEGASDQDVQLTNNPHMVTDGGRAPATIVV